MGEEGRGGGGRRRAGRGEGAARGEATYRALARCWRSLQEVRQRRGPGLGLGFQARQGQQARQGGDWRSDPGFRPSPGWVVQGGRFPFAPRALGRWPRVLRPRRLHHQLLYEPLRTVRPRRTGLSLYCHRLREADWMVGEGHDSSTL